MRINYLTLLCIPLFFISCSILYPTWKKTPQDIIKSATVEEDKFDNKKWVNFKRVRPYTLQDRKKVLGTYKTLNGIYYLRAFVNVVTNRPKFFQICIATDQNSSWGFYYKALDNSGKSLEFTKIDSQVSSYSNTVYAIEYFYLTFDIEYLRKVKYDNLIIKVYGIRDEFLFYIPQSYLEGVFEYFDLSKNDKKQIKNNIIPIITNSSIKQEDDINFSELDFSEYKSLNKKTGEK